MVYRSNQSQLPRRGAAGKTGRARPARPSRRSRRAAGYTLIELVMTMAIIAVMAGIAIPHYGRSLTRYQADVAARRVAADLALARGNARITSTSQTVNFSTPANGYTLAGMSDPNHPATGYAVDLTQAPYRATLVSASFGSAPAVKQVTFDRFGAPGAGGSVVVQSGDFKKTVTLDGTTGGVTIQ